MTDFTDKTALVTGAGRGIGRETALGLARQGANVVAADLDLASAEAVRDRIRQDGGQAEAFAMDSADAIANEDAVALARDRFGALHMAVNNAGIAGPRLALAEQPLEDWDRVIAVNLTGVFLGLRAQIPALQAAGGGSIVNISSILGSVGRANSAPYVAAKHGVAGLTKTAALDYAAAGVRVNAVAPGYIRTPLIERPDIDVGAVAALHPLGRLGEAPEVAELILFLLSDRASNMTGGYYPVDGGFLAQ